MIVLDTSVFIDAIFRFDSHRSRLAADLFRTAQNAGVSIIEPEIFKIELIGQLVRRIQKKEAFIIYNAIVSKIEFITIEKLREIAFSVAYDTGCRAIDSYFIAAAKISRNILITNDRIMAANAKKSNIYVYYLVDEFKDAIERLEKL